MRVDMTVLLDKSGSMSIMLPAMRRAFDKFMESQKGYRDQMFVSTYLFDNYGIHTLYERLAVDAVPPLTIASGGTTPLLDSMGETMTKVEARIEEAKQEYSAPNKVIFLVITDGQENDSTHWTKARVQKMVHQKEAENWEFLFMGANIDSFAEAQGVGISSAGTADFSTTAGSIERMFDTINQNLRGVRTGERADMHFTDQQRQAIK